MLALHEGPSGLPRGHLPFLGTAFFVSGASALVYQVAWQRILALHTGVGIESIAVIVGAFMAGLGIGSHLGSRLSLRSTAKSTLVAFASPASPGCSPTWSQSRAARSSWAARSLLEGPVKEYLGASLAHQVLERLRAARRVELVTDGEANDDLFPRDEFASPARKRPATVASQP